MAHSCNTSTRVSETGKVDLAHLLGEFQTSEGPCLQRKRWMVLTEWYSQMHIHTYTKHMRTPPTHPLFCLSITALEKVPFLKKKNLFGLVISWNSQLVPIGMWRRHRDQEMVMTTSVSPEPVEGARQPEQGTYLEGTQGQLDLTGPPCLPAWGCCQQQNSGL